MLVIFNLKELELNQIYLDQNIISRIAEGKLMLPVCSDIRWLFSVETISEINRAEKKQKYINVLVLLNALPVYRNKVIVDEKLYLPSFIEGVTTELMNEKQSNKKELLNEVLSFEASINYDDVFKTRALLGLNNNGVDRKISNERDPLKTIWDIIKNKTSLSKNEFFRFKVDGEHVSLSQGIINCTAVLNQIGYFPDKSLKKANYIENIFSDRWHVSQAAHFDGIISEDQRLCEKARAIYIWKKPSCTVYYPISKNKKIKCEERNGLKHFEQVSCLKKGWIY